MLKTSIRLYFTLMYRYFRDTLSDDYVQIATKFQRTESWEMKQRNYI